MSGFVVTKSLWGEFEGQPVHLYEVSNATTGVSMRVTDWGCTIVSLVVRGVDVVLGFDSLAQYTGMRAYYGCVVGRYANRIAGGQFSIDGASYQLACNNNGINHLHGGVAAFNRQIWKGRFVETASGGAALVFTHTSPDMHEGYPGTLQVTVVYELSPTDAALHIKYNATSDKATIVNLTNHSFFNLNLGHAATVVDHEIQIEADFFTPVTETLIPTGEIAAVAGTAFDFRQPTRIGARADGLYDHNWLVRGERGKMRLAARLTEPKTGRVMEVLTREPGIQFYTGKFIQPITGKNGVAYVQQGGLCLETQAFPDSPNRPHFSSTLLRPGQVYETETIYRFP